MIRESETQMKNLTLTAKLLKPLLTILIVGFSIYFYLSRGSIPGDLFNSDQISIPYLYLDLIQRHHELQYWNFSYSNYLFPDTLIYFLVKLFFNDFRVAELAVDCIMLCGYFFAIIALGRNVCGKSKQNIFLLSALVSLVLINTSLMPLFVPIFTSHFCSSVVIYMLQLLLITLLFKNPKTIYYWAITLLPFVTIFSDPITAGSLVGSIIVGMVGISRLIPKSERRVLIKIGILLVLAALASAVMTHLNLFGLHFDLYPFRIQFTLARVIILYKAFQNFAVNNPIIMLIMLVDILAAAWMFFKFIFRRPDASQLPLKEIPFWLVMFSTASCLPILFIFSWGFDYDVSPGNLNLFHFLPAILLPVFLGFPMWLAKYTDLKTMVDKYYFHLTGILLAYVLIFGTYQSILPVVNYYPDIAQCLDYYYESGQLLGSNGVADYWDAHPSVMLAKNHFNVVAVWQNYTPFDWMSTSQDYRDQKFNFIITRSNQEHLQERQTGLAQFGAPTAVLSCPVGSSPAQATHFIYTFKQAFVLPKPPPKHPKV